MHPALLIDEILQVIFEALLNDGKQSLCTAARLCQAWKDPALDRIWRRLPSAIPLLSLLPGFSMEKDDIRLGPTSPGVSYASFYSYSVRVKHIVHCHRVLADLADVPTAIFHQLCNLESARVESRAIGEVALRFSLAPRLRTLALQLGYSKSSTASVHSMMLLLQGYPSLEHLSVRGYSSECLHIPLGNITTLRSLSLHLSSLTVQSFMAVSTFPRLVEFDVHADRLSQDNLFPARDVPFFPALEKLKIRAPLALVTLIIGQLPRDKLRFVYLDTTGPAPSSAFAGLFNAMATLPIREFTLEHTDLSEDIPTYTLDHAFTLEHFQPLSKLPLTSFILGSFLPPDLSDPALEEMTKWWPHLERLELGARMALENTEATWKPRNSLASLFALTRGCKHLKSLVITLDAGSALSLPDFGPIADSHPLTSLSISSRSPPDVPLLSVTLGKLFPSLVDVTPGYVGGHEDAWSAIQTAVTDLALEVP